jgi:3-(3-hydroxy-phenyl)propionate hydroxylase
MNLGIEDAWVFAQLVDRGELNRYHALRYEIGKNVVDRIERVTRTIRGATPWGKAARRLLFPNLLRFKAVRQTMLKTVTGLDQPLPFGESE